MPVIYVYALSDFTTPIPDELGANAAGTPPFTIATGATLTRIEIEIVDADSNFDEIDPTQVLASDVTIGGVTYSAGDRIFGNYSLSNGTDPDLISVTIGVGNTGSNITNLVATLRPLEPNTSYTYTTETDLNGNPEAYSNFVCFTAGTLIATDQGERPIDDLQVNDRVLTRDDGLQRIRWIGSRTLTLAHPDIDSAAHPVCVPKDAFGEGIPATDLYLSPQHRILAPSYASQLFFGEAEVLSPVKSFVGRQATIPPRRGVTYYHLFFDRHQLIRSNGMWAESFFPGQQGMSELDRVQRAELISIFPELAQDHGINSYQAARPLMSVRESRLLC